MMDAKYRPTRSPPAWGYDWDPVAVMPRLISHAQVWLDNLEAWATQLSQRLPGLDAPTPAGR